MKYKQALNESTTSSDIEDILQVPEKPDRIWNTEEKTGLS